MHRRNIITQLKVYSETWTQGLFPYPGFNAQEEQSSVQKSMDFAEQFPQCFERDHYVPGHFTGSALITNARFDRVLLGLHGKLNKWLQLGGHADGFPLIDQVALREAEEESGLKNFNFHSYTRFFPKHLQQLYPGPLAFDLDCHLIPARPKEPEHWHFDIRYILVTDDSVPLVISEESQDLRWFSLTEARAVSSERSMHRQYDKLEFLRELNS